MAKENPDDMIVLTFRVRKSFRTMMDEIIDEMKGGTYTEVFRNAVFDRHRKIKPPYLEPSPNQEVKIEKAAKDKELADMDPEEYCRTIVQGLVLTSQDGTKYCVVHSPFGNNIVVRLLPDVKPYFDEYPEDLQTHLSKLSKEPLETTVELMVYKQILERKYKIVV